MKKEILFFLVLFLLLSDIVCFAADIVVNGEVTNDEWSTAEHLGFYPSEDSTTSITTLFIKLLVDKKEKTVYLFFTACDISEKEPIPYLRVNLTEFEIRPDFKCDDFSVEYARVPSFDNSHTDAELSVKFNDSIKNGTEISIAFIDGNGNWCKYYPVFKESSASASTMTKAQSGTDKSVSKGETKTVVEKTTDSTKRNDMTSRTEIDAAESDCAPAKNTDSQERTDKTNKKGYKPAYDNTTVYEETANKSDDEYKNEKAPADVQKGNKYIALMVISAAAFAAFCVEMTARHKSKSVKTEHIEAETENDENKAE